MILSRTAARPTLERLRHMRLSLQGYRRLTLATAIATWALIVLGGIVRATDSGLGCATWPMCDGSFLPKLEYHQLIEWNHRFFATLVGLLMIVTVGATILWYRRSRRLFWLALLAGVTYITQAVLGGITVLLKLPQTWIAAHMGNSMLLLAALVLLALFAYLGPVGIGEASRPIRYLALGTTLWTYVAMFTGSAVVGAQADLACPSWPFCADTNLLPLSSDQWINFSHRIAVGFSDVLMLLLAVAIWRTRRDHRRLMRATHALAAIYVAQVFLGAFTIWTGAPPAMKSIHLALAAAVWAALIIMTAFVWIGPPRNFGFAIEDFGGTGRDAGVPPDFGFAILDFGKPRMSDTPHAAAPVPGAAFRLTTPLPRAETGGRGVRTNGDSTTIQNPKSKIQNYVSLMKPRIIPLLLVPTAAAMLIANLQEPAPRPLLLEIIFTLIGGSLAAGGAHALNQYLERDIDGQMRRTRNRPVVTGAIAPRNALAFGLVVTTVAFAELWATTNLLAATLALAGNVFYVVVYTIWLKRTSVQNIVIGGAAGAVPPLVGWAAVTGNISWAAVLFFAVIFFWTPAHFWALALVRQEDYRAAGLPMLPVVRGGDVTRANILCYSVLVLIVTLLLFATHALDWLYLAAALGLGAVFVLRAAQLRRDTSTARAWRFFKFSNIYLALLYAAMVADRLVALGNPRVLLWSLITVLVLAGAGLILWGLNRAGWRGVLHHGT